MSEAEELIPFQLGQQVHHIYGLLTLARLQEDQETRLRRLCLNQKEDHYVLALTNVADVLVPFEVLAHFSSVSDRFAFVRFFKCCFQEDRYLVLFYFRCVDDLIFIFNLHQGRELSTLLGLFCEFYWVHSVSLVRRIDASSVSEEEEEFVSLRNMYSLIEDYSLIGSQQSEDDVKGSWQEDICTICLDKLQPSADSLNSPSDPHQGTAAHTTPASLVVLHCSHVFHYTCFLKVSNATCCPICRFQHDSGTANNPAINVCCSVCHSSGQAGSKQAVLASPPSSSSSSSSSRSSVLTGLQPTSLGLHLPFVDLWLCITCGFVGCGDSCHAHNYQHFLETRHTYIMNIVDQNVWDYSGCGYVYRIALDQPGGSEEELATHTKLAEISNFPQNYRSTQQFSSSSSDPNATQPSIDAVYDEKLGSLHKQYATVLQWRLGQDRQFYEQRLRSIWQSVGRSHEGGGFDISPIGGNLTAADNSSTWIEHIKMSLQLEKMKLAKQCQVLREKLERIAKEKDVNKALESHLSRNKDTLAKRLEDMKADLQMAEERFGNSIPALEGKVMQLMQQLDSTSSSAKSTSYREGGSG